VRATQHEELMREAGLEVERDLERTRRRAEHRRAVRLRIVHRLRTVTRVGVAIAWIEWVAGLVLLASEGAESRPGKILLGVGLGTSTVTIFAGLVVKWLTRADAVPAPPPLVGSGRLAPMRVPLHEKYMREAGFETDREHARRRLWRRRVPRVGSFLSVVGGVALAVAAHGAMHVHSHYLAAAVVAVALALGFVVVRWLVLAALIWMVKKFSELASAVTEARS
jgi:hypothetical protein